VRTELLRSHQAFRPHQAIAAPQQIFSSLMKRLQIRRRMYMSLKQT